MKVPEGQPTVSLAAECKALGNAAFKEKDYDAAITAFTEAIEADPTNHVFYSNRSGAHAAKADFKAALIDANECIKLNEQWAKGHSRRGAAYYGLKNWPQAQAAYERGLELDPNSALMKAELEKVKLQRDPAARAAKAAAEAAAAGAGAGGSYQRFPGDPGGFPSSGSCGPPTNATAKSAASAS